MASAPGITLAIGLLVFVGAGLWLTWRRPFVGIGVLVAGMAFHSYALMWLLRLGTPLALVRLFQGWKELVLLLLVVIALGRLWQSRREGSLGPMIAIDWVALAFAGAAVLYFVMPSSVLHSGVNLSQRLLGFRTVFLIPLVYFLGRIFGARSDRERLAVVWLCLGAAAAVTIFGIYELFLIPTRVWLDWGINQYTSFLGFTYHGPAGLPENFFLTLGSGTLVRRMVSTYISPLGVAYTALALFPMAVAVIDRRVPQQTARWIAMLTVLLIAGAALSLTRLALMALVAEAVLLWIVLRRAWVAGLVPALILAALIALFPYTTIAPEVDRGLGTVHAGPQGWSLANDSSTREHYGYLVQDLKVDLEHPLGLGTGASTIRYGNLNGTGESAVLGMFGDLGVAGGLLYVALYGLALWHGWRALRMSRRASLEEVLPLVAFVGGLGLVPITMTSDVWGDLSVTFIFWWAAGASATLSIRADRAAPRAVWDKREQHKAA